MCVCVCVCVCVICYSATRLSTGKAFTTTSASVISNPLPIYHSRSDLGLHRSQNESSKKKKCVCVCMCVRSLTADCDGKIFRRGFTVFQNKCAAVVAIVEGVVCPRDGERPILQLKAKGGGCNVNTISLPVVEGDC